MALIKCRECGKELSATALVCPHCGFPNKRKSKLGLIIIAIFTIVLLITSVILLSNFVQKKASEDSYKKIDSLASLDVAIYGDNSVILLSQTTCSYCKKFKPVLEKVQNDYNLDVYEITLDELDSELFDDMTSADNDFGDFFYENNEWGTPLLLLFRDGELVGSLSGYTEEENLVEILKDYDFI